MAPRVTFTDEELMVAVMKSTMNTVKVSCKLLEFTSRLTPATQVNTDEAAALVRASPKTVRNRLVDLRKAHNIKVIASSKAKPASRSEATASPRKQIQTSKSPSKRLKDSKKGINGGGDTTRESSVNGRKLSLEL